MHKVWLVTGKGVRQLSQKAKEYFAKGCDSGNQECYDAYRLLNENGIKA